LPCLVFTTLEPVPAENLPVAATAAAAAAAPPPPGIDDLLQTVLWVAEDKQLMANPNRLAAGTVIEAHLDKKRGPVATLLVQVGGEVWLSILTFCA
jgi:translation initiation factor IF-2